LFTLIYVNAVNIWCENTLQASLDAYILILPMHVSWAGNEYFIRQAKSRWLRPSEICEILRGHNRFNLTVDPPHKPPSKSDTSHTTTL